MRFAKNHQNRYMSDMLHIGFAETDITPKLGSQSPGGMQARRLNEVHDPLKAVAMVIQNDRTAVALVGIDSIFISEEATASAREAITAATKIPGSHVLIGASHTHGGGPVATCFESDADPEYVDLVAHASPRLSSRLFTRCMPPSWATASATSPASASIAVS